MTDRWIYTNDPRARANNPQAAARAIHDRHAATVAAIRDALAAKITVDAADLLDALLALLATDGPVATAAAYTLEANTAAARMRRQAAAAAEVAA